MMEIFFSRVTFSQANKYIFVVQVNQQIKRTQVCHQWTSAPLFNQSIKFQDFGSLVIKACVVTYQKKLTVLGNVQIQQDQILKKIVKNQGKQSNIDYDVFQTEKQIIHRIQGKKVCVGRCHIKIILSRFKNLEKSKTNSVKLNESIHSQNINNSRLAENQYLDNFQEFQLNQNNVQQLDESDQNFDDQIQKRCQIRFLIHCGFNFYLNSSFGINIKWCGTNLNTKFVRDKITPIWAENILMNGNQHKMIQLNVIDGKKNLLQWIKFRPKELRIMFPYHFKCVFRQQHMGQIPQIYFSIIRQDIPRFSIIQKQINLFVNPVNEKIKIKENQYLLLDSSGMTTNPLNQSNISNKEKEFRFPQFIQLQLQNKLVFDVINKHIDQKGSRWSLLVPVSMIRSFNQNHMSVLKSFMNKNINIFLLGFYDWKKVFQIGNKNHEKLMQGLQIVQQKGSFENILKQIYYHNEKFCLKKRIQISNADDHTKSILSQGQQKVSQEQQWRIMSYNYSLRQQMVRKTQKNIDQYKKRIQQKGQQLVKLKKTLNQVKDINKLLLQKQQTALVEVSTQDKNDSRKQRLKVLQGKYHIQDIIQTLYAKQSQLKNKKRNNDQIRARMESLSHYQDNLQQLNKIIINNAHNLHSQLEKLKKMNIMKDIIPKQRLVISKLQKIFEQRQIDRQMNMLLERQNLKLQEIQRKKRKDLEIVYQTISELQKVPLSFRQRCQKAQEELKQLNAHYVKLQNLG